MTVSTQIKMLAWWDTKMSIHRTPKSQYKMLVESNKQKKSEDIDSTNCCFSYFLWNSYWWSLAPNNDFLGKGEGGGGREMEEGYSRIMKSWCVFRYKDNTYLSLMTCFRSPGIEIWDTFVHSGQSFLPSPDVRC